MNQEEFKFKMQSFLESNERSINVSNISFYYVKETLEELGFTEEDDWDINGWQVDYWVSFTKDNLSLKLSGSMYYGSLSIYKEYD